MIGTRHPESSPTESTHHRVTETGFRLSAGRLPRIGRTRQALAIGYSTCQSADTNLYHSEALSTTETGWFGCMSVYHYVTSCSTPGHKPFVRVQSLYIASRDD